MAFKAVLASMLLVHSALGQCLGNAVVPCGVVGQGLSSGYGQGYGCGHVGVASTGGSLPVSSASPIAPVGISVISENAYEGQLYTSGNLPFLGGVIIEGAYPSAGTGVVSYGCGDEAVGISNEVPAAGILTPEYFAPSVAGYGNFAGYGLGGAAGYGLGGISGYGSGAVSGFGGPSCGCGC